MYKNHDQTMIYAWNFNCKYWVPRECQDMAGKKPKQGSKDTVTNVSTIEYNFKSKQTTLGPNVLILHSERVQKPYPGMSKYLERKLQEVDLLKSMNKKYSTFITSSNNGWNQVYNIPDQRDLLFEKGAIVETDNWTYFNDMDHWILPAFDRLTFPNILPPNVTGAIQWLDRSFNGELKRLHNENKRILHTRFNTFEKDHSAHDVPICHTANGNPKALPQHYQALTLCQAFEDLKEKEIDWKKQLLQNGYLWFTDLQETREHYLEHLQDSMTGNSTIFGCINNLKINPFEASFEAILSNYKQEKGPKMFDVGKLSRVYSKHEVSVLKEIYDHNKSNEKSNSNSNDIDCNSNNSNPSENNNCNIAEFNNTMHFEIIKECTEQIAAEIKEACELPNREDCDKPEHFKDVWLGCQTYDMIFRYNEILQQKYGPSNVCNRQSNNDNITAKEAKKQQLLNKMEEKINYLKKLHLKDSNEDLCETE